MWRFWSNYNGWVLVVVVVSKGILWYSASCHSTIHRLWDDEHLSLNVSLTSKWTDAPRYLMLKLHFFQRSFRRKSMVLRRKQRLDHIPPAVHFFKSPPKKMIQQNPHLNYCLPTPFSLTSPSMLMPFDVSQKDSIEEHHDIHNMPPDGQTTRWRHTPPNGGFGWNIHWGSPTLGGWVVWQWQQPCWILRGVCTSIWGSARVSVSIHSKPT